MDVNKRKTSQGCITSTPKGSMGHVVVLNLIDGMVLKVHNGKGHGN